MKLFKITETAAHTDDIEVFISRGNKSKCVLILRGKYEKWLEDSGRLEMESNWVDHHGDHQQDIYNIPIDCYWADMRNEKIEENLYDYIVINYTDPFNIKPALDMILENAFPFVTAAAARKEEDKQRSYFTT